MTEFKACGNPCSRRVVEEKIKKALCGNVPGLFSDKDPQKTMPDSVLNFEWELFRHFEFAPLIPADYPAPEPVIPLKYRQLIGIALHSETKCKYCAPFHIALAKLAGATDVEIQEAVNYVKHSLGVSAYLNGLDFDLDEFLKELEVLGACLERKVPRPQGEVRE